MALVRKLQRSPLQVDAPHKEVDATYSIVETEGGSRVLQIDTYGSKERKLKGKKSQSIRFSPEALAELQAILKSDFGLA